MRAVKKNAKVWTYVQSGPTLSTYIPWYGQNLIWTNIFLSTLPTYPISLNIFEKKSLIFNAYFPKFVGNIVVNDPIRYFQGGLLIKNLLRNDLK